MTQSTKARTLIGLMALATTGACTGCSASTQGLQTLFVDTLTFVLVQLATTGLF